MCCNLFQDFQVREAEDLVYFCSLFASVILNRRETFLLGCHGLSTTICFT